MKLQRRFAPISGEFAPESVARFIGIRTYIKKNGEIPHFSIFIGKGSLSPFI